MSRTWRTRVQYAVVLGHQIDVMKYEAVYVLIDLEGLEVGGVHHAALVEPHIERRRRLHHKYPILDTLPLQYEMQVIEEHLEMWQPISVGYDYGHLEVAHAFSRLPVPAQFNAGPVVAVVRLAHIQQAHVVL